MSAASKYRDALATAPAAGEGRTHTWMLSAANLGAIAGIDSATVEREIADALGPRGRARLAEIHAAVGRAFRDHDRREAGHYTPPPPRPRPAKRTVQAIQQRGAGATEADLRDLSPARVDFGDEHWREAATMLHALFHPGELVTCAWEDDDRRRFVTHTCADWCQRLASGEGIPPFVVVNPIKPEGGMTKGENPHNSFACDDAVAVFRHCLVEFDKMPLTLQWAFWKGFGLGAVSVLAFSGNKSIHALVRVDSANVDEYNRDVRERLFARFNRFEADGATVNPARTARLAGARRPDNGAIQRLVFAREALV